MINGGYLPFRRTRGYSAVRLNFLTNGANTASLAEWRVADTIDASAQILTGGSIAATSVNGSQTADLAIDSNNATYWQTQTNPFPCQLTYTFGSGQFKTPILVTFQVGTAISPISGTFNFEATTNGTTWTVLHAFDASGGAGKDFSPLITNVDYAFPLPSSAEVWRIVVTATQGGTNTLAIREMVLKVGAGGSQLLTGGVAYGSSAASSGNDFSKAFDGGANNFASTTTLPTTLGYILPVGTNITPDTLAITVVGATNGPSAWTLEKSTDGGVTWTTKGTYTESGWTNFDTQSYSVSA